MPELVIPNHALAASFRQAMADFAAEGRGARDDHSAVGTDLRTYSTQWYTELGMRRYLHALLHAGDTSIPPPADWVHTDTYWWAEARDYLGSIRIRHRLTPSLLQIGGHIGYDIAPKARRRGHATAMLAAALPLAAELDIDPALITCDVHNVASRRVIEHNGGELIDERQGKLRFWVPAT